MDDLSFTIIPFPSASTTIASSAFYSSIVAKGLIISRENSEGSSFYMSCITIVQRTIKKGARKQKICEVISTLLIRHLYEFSNSKSSITQFLHDRLDFV